jgi:hypothetical protein
VTNITKRDGSTLTKHQLRLTKLAITLGGALYFIKTTKRGQRGSGLGTDAFRPLSRHHVGYGSSEEQKYHDNVGFVI